MSVQTLPRAKDIQHHSSTWWQAPQREAGQLGLRLEERNINASHFTTNYKPKNFLYIFRLLSIRIELLLLFLLSWICLI